jgi:protein-disulfide isomerase
VTLLEYGDFECPYCGAAHSIIRDIERQMGSEMCFCYRHFPLTSAHPHAGLAAQAAEAAGVQGKFWELHDTLFEQQVALDEADLIRYAVSLGLDHHRFARELANQTYAPRVHEDLISGARSGVNGTPTFFINGVRHEGPFDYDTLLGVVERAVAEAGSR